MAFLIKLFIALLLFLTPFDAAHGKLLGKRNSHSATTAFTNNKAPHPKPMYKIVSPYDGAWNDLPRYPPFNLYPPMKKKHRKTFVTSVSSKGATEPNNKFVTRPENKIVWTHSVKYYKALPYLVAIHNVRVPADPEHAHTARNGSKTAGGKEDQFLIRLRNPDDYSGALAYIVFVLIFYSTAIVIMMAKYMRREHKEYQEAEKYQKYVKSAREVYMRSISRSRVPNRLALQAFNTVNLIPQIVNDEDTPKITYV